MSPYSHNPDVPLSNILLWWWKGVGGGGWGGGGFNFKRRSVSLIIMCRAVSKVLTGLTHRCKSISTYKGIIKEKCPLKYKQI